MEVRQQIREFILSQFMDGCDPDELQDDLSLERSHLVDSAGTLEVIMYLEETFGIVVDTDDATPENFDTINGLVSFVERKREELE